jgi:RNA polymerase sigma factor (sigma-70 family)
MTPDGLFEKNRGLSVHMAVKYARKYPQVILKDLIQECDLALHQAAKTHNPKVPSKKIPGTFIPFGPYALRALVWACVHHVRTLRDAPEEISLGNKIRSQGKQRTLENVLSDEVAEQELQDDIPYLREKERIADLRELIHKLPPLEQRVLKLLYIDGLEGPDVMDKLGINYMAFRNAGLSGIKKLRSHFRKMGVSVARGALETGILSGTMRRLKKQSAKNPKCVKAGKIGGPASVKAKRERR